MEEVLLVYRPLDNTTVNDYSPLCHDSKIHIRFTDYLDKQTIIGFEAKLTYLLQNIFIDMTRGILETQEFKNDKRLLYSEDSETYIWNKYIKLLKQTDAYNFLFNVIANKYLLKDIKFKPYYCKTLNKGSKDNWTQFGFHKDDFVIIKDDISMWYLQYFLTKFHIKLEDYLFNDNYILILTDTNFKNPNTKFENKSFKKLEKKFKNKTPYTENNLW